MSEDNAQTILRETLGVSRETMARLSLFGDMVIAENSQQNLISASTIPRIWQRHILDSAQLIRFMPSRGHRLDLGSGAGFPGVILALLQSQPIILIESRRKRIDFLQRAIDVLGLRHVIIHGGTLESLSSVVASAIVARAFAPLPKLFDLAHRFSIDETVWILPKGRRANEELTTAHDSWRGRFRVERSLSDPDASIIVASAIQPLGLSRGLE